MTVRVTTMQATIEALIHHGVTAEWELVDGQVFTGQPTSLFRDGEGYWVDFKRVVEEGGCTAINGSRFTLNSCAVEGC